MSEVPGRIGGMQNLTDALESIADTLHEVVADAFREGVLRAVSEEELLAVMVTAGRVMRSAEAMLIDAVAQADARGDHAESVTVRAGCRSLSELVQRATRVSKRTAADVVTAARAVTQRTSVSLGEVLPADYPAMRDAVADSVVGVDGVVAVAGTLRAHAGGWPGGIAGVLAADTELALSARGAGGDGAPPACAEDLRAQAHIWALYLDQDGQEPREARAARKRGYTLGVARDGLVPLRGNLLPEVAAQLQLAFDSILNPKLEGPAVPGAGRGPRFAEVGEQGGDGEDQAWDPDGLHPEEADLRTRAQKQHDAFATILTVAAASGTLPTLGGAAPTLVVSVREEDLVNEQGAAHLDGVTEPVPISVARHIGCTGTLTRVTLGAGGRIVSLTTHDRVFTHHQRKAIALRDGGCVIPGCHIPASWCEIHHVTEHSRGGPTHTDNGVLLCWHHHRTLDTSGWRIRMTAGTPEIRGPARWDPHQKWRAVTKSPTRRHDILARRS
ncbi:HNH endonuclease signature motif containing protein [Microbacterium aureliae]